MKVQEHANVKSRTFFENLLLGSFLFLSWKSTVVQQNAQFWKFCEKSYNSRLSKWKPKKLIVSTGWDEKRSTRRWRVLWTVKRLNASLKFKGVLKLFATSPAACSTQNSPPQNKFGHNCFYQFGLIQFRSIHQRQVLNFCGTVTFSRKYAFKFSTPLGRLNTTSLSSHTKEGNTCCESSLSKGCPETTWIRWEILIMWLALVEASKHLISFHFITCTILWKMFITNNQSWKTTRES